MAPVCPSVKGGVKVGGQGWVHVPWHQHNALCVPKAKTGAKLPPRGGLGQIPPAQAEGLLTFV